MWLGVNFSFCCGQYYITSAEGARKPFQSLMPPPDPGDRVFPTPCLHPGVSPPMLAANELQFSLSLSTWAASPAFVSVSGGVTWKQVQAGSLVKIIVSTFSLTCTNTQDRLCGAHLPGEFSSHPYCCCPIVA